MDWNKYISQTGLGLLSEKDRKNLRRVTLDERYRDWKKTGLSRREALGRALMGTDPAGFPTYLHRSSDLTRLQSIPKLIDRGVTWEPSHGFKGQEAQAVIDAYIERCPR